jgi:hypothetical protein
MNRARKSGSIVRQQQARANTSRGCLTVFFSIFFIIGSVIFYVIFVRPVLSILAARQWPEVPCVIKSSEVEENRGEDGPTYRVKITFEYEYDGVQYTSERYSFSDMSSSGRAGKQKVVAQYPPGKQATCFVDPDEPNYAVIHRGWTNTLWFGLIPLVFVLIGAGGMLGSLFYKPKKVGVEEEWMPTDPSAADSGGEPAGTAMGPRELKAESSRLGRFLGVCFLCVFWNGIVSVFIGILIRSIREGDIEWFLAVFLIPFELIGLGLIGGVIYMLLGLFNPRPTVTLLAYPLLLGTSLEIRWQFTGRTSAIRKLRIALEGTEKATYRRGTSTTTDTRTFASLGLVETTDPHAMAAGSARIQIPARTMHSFKSRNNEISWVIRVAGEIARWPDVNESFPVVVQPPPRLDHQDGSAS